MTAIQQALCALADEAYRDFQSALLPTVEKERILGVRTPVLRRYAKELWKREPDAAKEFLRQLPQKDCCLFIRRYWYMDSVPEIASRYHMAMGSVKSSLHRSRKRLKEFLEQEGITG